MNSSILTSTKKILNVDEDYTAFDLDIITHINAAFSVLNQIGIGPEFGFAIEDASAKWSDLNLPANQLGMVRSYIYLKTRMLFDPPSTSYLITATEKQIEQFEWRLNVMRENLIVNPTPEEVEV